jgi:hypothetical protein
MGGLVVPSLPQDGMIESLQRERNSHSNQIMEIVRDYRPQRPASPDMRRDLIVGALAMLALVGLVHLILTYS